MIVAIISDKAIVLLLSETPSSNFIESEAW